MCKQLLEATPQLLNWPLKSLCLISTFSCCLYVVTYGCSAFRNMILCFRGRVGTKPDPLQSTGPGGNADWGPLKQGQSQTSSACGYTGLKSHFRYQCQRDTTRLQIPKHPATPGLLPSFGHMEPLTNEAASQHIPFPCGAALPPPPYKLAVQQQGEAWQLPLRCSSETGTVIVSSHPSAYQLCVKMSKMA